MKFLFCIFPFLTLSCATSPDEARVEEHYVAPSATSSSIQSSELLGNAPRETPQEAKKSSTVHGQWKINQACIDKGNKSIQPGDPNYAQCMSESVKSKPH